MISQLAQLCRRVNCSVLFPALDFQPPTQWQTTESSAPSLNATQQAGGSVLQCFGTWKTKRAFSSPGSACMCVCVRARPAVFVLWQTDFISGFPVYHQRCISRNSQVLRSLSPRWLSHQSSPPWRALKRRLKGQFAKFSQLIGCSGVNKNHSTPCVCAWEIFRTLWTISPTSCPHHN